MVQGLLLAAMRMLHDSPHRTGVVAPFAENLLLIQFGGTGQYGNQIAGGPANGNATGQGARFDLDGEHSAGFFWAMVVDCPGPEEQERKFPWVYLFRNRFDRDVCGVGRYRGGVGPHRLLRDPRHGRAAQQLGGHRQPVHQELRPVRRLLGRGPAPHHHPGTPTPRP